MKRQPIAFATLGRFGAVLDLTDTPPTIRRPDAVSVRPLVLAPLSPAPALDPHRTLTQTPACDVPGAILLDQSGVHQLPFDAIFALDVPDTAFARVSPFRAGYRLLGAANADAERDQLPATFSVMGSALLYKGACAIVAHCDATGETAPLTLDELFYVLRHVYVLTTYGTPDANVVWMVDLPEGGDA